MRNIDDRTLNFILALIIALIFVLVGYLGYDNLFAGIVVGGIIFIIILCATSDD